MSFLVLGTGCSASDGGPKLSVPVPDGRTLTFSSVSPLADWACGTRKSALLDGQKVVLYFDRAGTLVSANVPDNAPKPLRYDPHQAAHQASARCRGAPGVRVRCTLAIYDERVEKLYERDSSRSCVKNWQSGEFEMLTDSEYRRSEKKARRKAR